MGAQAESGPLAPGPQGERATPSRRRRWLVACGIFLAIRVATWGLGYGMAATGSWPLDRMSYLLEFHHSELDPRIRDPEAVSFPALWRYADAEWYTAIAESGYPNLDELRANTRLPMGQFRSTQREGYRRYAFLPLYPLAVRVLTPFMPIATAALVATFLLGLLAVLAFVHFFDVYFPERREESGWSLALLLLFPFSVFYALYYAEVVFLALSLMLFAALERERYLEMGLWGALLCLSRPTGAFVLAPVGLVLLWRTRALATEGRWRLVRAYGGAALIPLGLVPFFVLCQVETGHWDMYRLAVVQGWGTELGSVADNLAEKLRVAILGFGDLPLHAFRYSKVETAVMVAAGALLVWMWTRRDFPRVLTGWATLMWLVPVLTGTQTTSFSRYMIVAFPLFVFLGLRLPRWLRGGLLVAFAVGYYLALELVIRYRWLG
jgi:hypothetical protein